MKKTILSIACAALLLTSCGAGLGTVLSAATGATGGSDILGTVLGAATDGNTLGNILGSVLGTDKPTQKELCGTWTYKQPGVAFTSENLLAQAGGEVAATAIRQKLAGAYQTVGISSSNTAIQFNQDGTFTARIAGKQLSGNYTYDEKDCKVTMKTLLLTMPAYVKKSTTGLSVLFEAKKLLTVMQTIGAMSGNSNLQTISDLAKNYDGLRMGLDMSR